ncbi:MAG: hypothetical protein H7836_15740 [Magnetococcus sp. YQC-3]
MIRQERILSRRRFLVNGLLAGSALLGGGCVPMVVHQGVRTLNAAMRVSGRSVGLDAIVMPGDTVSTGEGGASVLVIGHDAFLLAANTRATFHSSHLAATASAESTLPASAPGLTLATGKILAVFGSGRKLLNVPRAVIAIRGTGIFLRSDPDQDYACLCYGTAELQMRADPNQRELLQARHHDVPRFLTADGKIQPAPMLDHTDEELIMLESLVGRSPPFVGHRTGY